jgi:hypothetical protein
MNFSLSDLQPWARKAFEKMYRQRDREQASREDLAYGFIAGLYWLGSKSSFTEIACIRLWPAD